VWLPALVYDFKRVTMAWNLLPREYEEQSKPITRYFQMMIEIVEDAADVRILRRAGVVRGGSSGGQEVHELKANQEHRRALHVSARVHGHGPGDRQGETVPQPEDGKLLRLQPPRRDLGLIGGRHLGGGYRRHEEETGLKPTTNRHFGG
jgi:hypothetical protein